MTAVRYLKNKMHLEKKKTQMDHKMQDNLEKPVIKTNLRLRIEENSFDQNHHPSHQRFVILNTQNLKFSMSRI